MLLPSHQSSTYLISGPEGNATFNRQNFYMCVWGGGDILSEQRGILHIYIFLNHSLLLFVKIYKEVLIWNNGHYAKMSLKLRSIRNCY